VRVLWQAERGSRRTRRHPRDDPRAEVGEDVRVGVRVGPVEFQLYDSCWSLAEASLVTENLEWIDVKPHDDTEPRTCAGTPLDGVSTALIFDREEARRRRTTVMMSRMTRTDSVMAKPTANTTVTDV